MRVATLSLRGTRDEWAARRGVLRDCFRRYSPDLVTFQESVVTGGYDQVHDILGPGYHVVHQTVRGEDGRGVSTASRWPIHDIVEVDLDVSARTLGYACTSLVAETFAPAPIGRVLLVNNRPGGRLDMEREREIQAVRAARTVEELAARRPAHVVVAGDFDADPDAASLRFWCGRQSLHGLSVCYRDAWVAAHPADSGHTRVPGGLPFGRVDYVLVRCGPDGPTLAVEGCERILDEPVDGVWASDHFGLIADLVPLTE
ncbi:MAG TPA: endonuclease/exonuclease/phosphatase family protein [Pseudonocardiaceae bacterium]|jgi:endonuclease/exonuclease/phosphatase family metal-dependent hydrolase|nr:endonuclease/exonuclease/phosphatase family protein [Pseudonocardiaceae bacterium]